MVRCCICEARHAGPDDAEGILCRQHWQRVPAETRRAYLRAMGELYRAQRRGKARRLVAWEAAVSAMVDVKDAARLSLDLDTAA